MKVRINIGLDFDGNHTFTYEESDDPRAVEIPKSTLDRWSSEREAFTVAFLRWKRVIEEIEETLYKAENSRAEAAPALVLARASRPANARR